MVWVRPRSPLYYITQRGHAQRCIYHTVRILSLPFTDSKTSHDDFVGCCQSSREICKPASVEEKASEIAVEIKHRWHNSTSESDEVQEEQGLTGTSNFFKYEDIKKKNTLKVLTRTKHSV